MLSLLYMKSRPRLVAHLLISLGVYIRDTHTIRMIIRYRDISHCHLKLLYGSSLLKQWFYITVKYFSLTQYKLNEFFIHQAEKILISIVITELSIFTEYVNNTLDKRKFTWILHLFKFFFWHNYLNRLKVIVSFPIYTHIDKNIYLYTHHGSTLFSV